MMNNKSVKETSSQSVVSDIPDFPNYTDTLENSIQLLELLEYIDFSEGMNKDAQFGLFLVFEMLIESMRHVSGGLKIKSQVPE